MAQKPKPNVPVKESLAKYGRIIIIVDRRPKNQWEGW
jgi:hypothetical protein